MQDNYKETRAKSKNFVRYADGAELYSIQEIMGHADIQTTMDIYAEATEEKKQEVFSNLQGKIF